MGRCAKLPAGLCSSGQLSGAPRAEEESSGLQTAEGRPCCSAGTGPGRRQGPAGLMAGRGTALFPPLFPGLGLSGRGQSRGGGPSAFCARGPGRPCREAASLRSGLLGNRAPLACFLASAAECRGVRNKKRLCFSCYDHAENKSTCLEPPMPKHPLTMASPSPQNEDYFG